MLKTQIIKVHPKNPESGTIKKAAELIRKNRLVVYPTESAYALGCNALEERAVRKVFEAKGRLFGTPLPIIVSDLEMWETCAFIDERPRKLIETFLPGPLSIALKKKPIVPDALNPKAIAARISSNPIAKALVKEANVPLTATSANTSGTQPHYTAKQVLKDLSGKVDLILDAGRLPKRQLSTIVDFTISSVPRITRIGAIPAKAISKVIDVKVATK